MLSKFICVLQLYLLGCRPRRFHQIPFHGSSKHRSHYAFDSSGPSRRHGNSCILRKIQAWRRYLSTLRHKSIGSASLPFQDECQRQTEGHLHIYIYGWH
ncbi:hypothetical protein B0H13DRAFT_301303 [Mycena leptocephala]|nr:hypothetical protein B0H13DRAFT_301303 [Mycena leptocephala]